MLGAFLAWLLVRRPADRYLRPFVAIGFLGGYTTFSTAMVESAVLAKDGHVDDGRGVRRWRASSVGCSRSRSGSSSRGRCT